MLARSKGFKKAEKLNLVPIMDSVFIFIFFLLSSAQFIEISEIGTSTPVTKEISTPDDKKPFNLVFIAQEDNIRVEFGLENKEVKTFQYDQREEILSYLRELKSRYPNESTLRLRTPPTLRFERAVQAIDLTQDSTKKETLFPQIVFEKDEGSI